MEKKIVDLSYYLNEETKPFPDNAPFKLKSQQSIPLDHPAGLPGYVNSSAISTNLHNGTHLDAPHHFYNNRKVIDEVPLGSCMGKAHLIDLSGKKPKEVIDADDLRPHDEQLNTFRIILIRTGWSLRWGQSNYFTEFPYLSRAAAQYLAEKRIQLFGIDTPSVDYPPNEAHFILLGNDILIVENLTNLDCLKNASFEFIALPLKISNAEASPVRAVAILDA